MTHARAARDINDDPAVNQIIKIWENTLRERESGNISPPYNNLSVWLTNIEHYATLGHTHAQFLLGKFAESKQEWEKSFRWYKLASANNHFAAKFSLACHLAEGRPFYYAADLNQAAQLFFDLLNSPVPDAFILHDQAEHYLKTNPELANLVLNLEMKHFLLTFKDKLKDSKLDSMGVWDPLGLYKTTPKHIKPLRDMLAPLCDASSTQSIFDTFLAVQTLLASIGPNTKRTPDIIQLYDWANGYIKSINNKTDDLDKNLGFSIVSSRI